MENGNMRQYSTYKLISAKEIQAMEYPPIEWIVENILIAGLTIIAGGPKIGKSFFCMNLALSITRGEKALGCFNVTRSDVVYFALEDHGRRIKTRIDDIIRNEADSIAPENFYFLEKNQDFLKLNVGGMEQLESLLMDLPNIKLIIIDTLGRSRADQGRKDNNIYLADYDLLSQLQGFALRKKICIVLVHHTKKGAEENVFDEVSGTKGITGAADTLIMIKKVKGEYRLYLTGRDIAEAEYNIYFDDSNCTWNIIEEVKNSYETTIERQAIVDLLSAENRSMKTGEISERLKKSLANTSKLLSKLKKDGVIESAGYGSYVIKSHLK